MRKRESRQTLQRREWMRSFEDLVNKMDSSTIGHIDWDAAFFWFYQGVSPNVAAIHHVANRSAA